MSTKPVTTAQIEQIRKMAREKEVDSQTFQRGLDDGTFAAAIDAVKEKVLNPLLKLVVTVKTAAIAKFTAAEAFGAENSAGIKFWLGDNFRKHFLGKIEENVPEGMLDIRQLRRSSLDGPILAELGDKAETTLAQLYELLKLQAQGQAGMLLVNGYANIFYVRDQNGTLWAVDAYWDSFNREWRVEAYSVEDPNEWYDEDQVFSQAAGD